MFNGHNELSLHQVVSIQFGVIAAESCLSTKIYLSKFCVTTYLVEFCQKDPGESSLSVNVPGYHLLSFIGPSDRTARNWMNRMLDGHNELSRHQVVSVLLGVTAAESCLSAKIYLSKFCAA